MSMTIIRSLPLLSLLIIVKAKVNIIEKVKVIILMTMARFRWAWQSLGRHCYHFCSISLTSDSEPDWEYCVGSGLWLSFCRNQYWSIVYWRGPPFSQNQYLVWFVHIFLYGLTTRHNMFCSSWISLYTLFSISFTFLPPDVAVKARYEWRHYKQCGR